MSRSEYYRFLMISSLSFLPLVMVPLGGRSDHFYLPKVIAMGVVAILFVGAWLLRGSPLTLDRVNLALMLYVGWLLIAFVQSRDLELALWGRPYRHEGLVVLLFYALFFLLGRVQAPLKARDFVPVLAIALLLSVYGWVQTQGITLFERDVIRVAWINAFATFGNPNFMASYLVVMVILSYGLYLEQGRFWILALMGTLSYAVVLTRTQSAFIGLAVGLSALSLIAALKGRLMRRRVRIALGVSLNGFLVMLLSVPMFRQELSQLLMAGARFIQAPFLDETAGSYRIFIWVRVWELIQWRPWFGVGIEHLGRVFNQRFAGDIMEVIGQPLLVDRAHNEYLHIAVSVGLPGLLLYLHLLAHSLWGRLTQRSLIDISVFAALLGYLAQAFFNISVVSVAYVFWLLLGYFSRPRNRTKEAIQSE